MSWQIEKHNTANCAGLRSGLWLPDTKPKSQCLFLPGLGDFLEKRSDVAARLAAEGHAVLSFDWCGQGGSGRRGLDLHAAHADDFAKYGEDALAILRERARPELPLWVLAYSMGATVTLPLLDSGALVPTSLVLVSPMLRLLLPVPEPVALMAASVAVSLGFGRVFAPGEAEKSVMGTSAADVTDPACQMHVADLAAKSPEYLLRGVTWGWSRAALAGVRAARAVSWRKGPVLIVRGDHEKSVDLSPVGEMAQRLGARVVNLPGGHDLFLAGPATQDCLFAEISGTVNAGLTSREMDA